MDRFKLPACLLLLAALAPARSFAQPAPTAPTGALERQNPIPGPVGGANPAEGPSPGEPGFSTQLFSSSRGSLLGDGFGVRTALGNYGISLGLSEISEVFGNATGGVRRGAAYDGLTVMSLGVDTQRAFGFEGGTFNVSAFQIHGRNLSAENLYSLNTNSGIQANRATRLWELWYQQEFRAARVDVKVGQQSLDEEFIGSTYAGTFINTMFGWPIIPSYDMYAGGPAYPLSSLGVRLRARPTNAITVLAGVFDDNPSGGPFYDDSQVRGAEQSGAKFNLKTGALIFGEIQYAINQPAEGDFDTGQRSNLAGTYKLGGWFDTGRFPDQRFDGLGLSLADPNSDGNPRFRRTDFSLYATADQVIWQPDPVEPMSVGVFARVMGAPSDRNLISYGVNAGVVLKAPFHGREGDSVGVAYGLAQVGRNASLLDKDTNAFGGTIGPVRSSESFVEVTYQYVVAPWWQLQPDFQYIYLPGAGIANPLNPAKRIGNEAVFGLRTNITF